MRTDYVLYIIALICFIVAGYSLAYPFTEFTANTVIVAVLAIIGVVFIWGGYSLRPGKLVVTPTKPQAPPTKPALEEQPPAPMMEPVPEPAPSEIAAEPEPEPTPTPTPMPEPEPEKAEEMPPPETPLETKKPVRKRRERKKD
jgi:outer membrane biosynthesis protein TonB